MATATRYKSKIGAHLSYPCTLTELDTHLAPASQRHDVEVSFRDWKAPRKNELRAEYQLLEASHSRRSFGEHIGKWHYGIAVYPVPRAMRAHIRRLLFPRVADRVRDWLLADHHPIWYTSPHRFSVHFDAVSDQLSFREHPKT